MSISNWSTISSSLYVFHEIENISKAIQTEFVQLDGRGVFSTSLVNVQCDLLSASCEVLVCVCMRSICLGNWIISRKVSGDYTVYIAMSGEISAELKQGNKRRILHTCQVVWLFSPASKTFRKVLLCISCGCIESHLNSPMLNFLLV
jgi:hypothetical protein